MTNNLLKKHFPFDLPDLSLDAREIDTRLHNRLTLAEFGAAIFALVMIVGFTWYTKTSSTFPADFLVYYHSPEDPLFHYGYWIAPLLQLFQKLPFETAYFFWALLNLTGVIFACKVFGGSIVLAITSYQMLSLLYYGNFSGILVGGAALFWYGMAHQKWWLAGLGFLLASTKYHFAIFIGLPLLWWAKPDFRSILKMAIIPILIVLASLIIYPGWLATIWQRVSHFGFFPLGITLWKYIGAWCLLLWIPVLILPFSRNRRLFAMLVTAFLASPYWLQTELLLLFSMPVGLMPLFGAVGFLFPWLDVKILLIITLLLCGLYLIIILPALIEQIKPYLIKHRKSN